MKLVLLVCLVLGTTCLIAAHSFRISGHWLLAGMLEMFGLICAMEFVWTLEENVKERNEK